MVGKQCVIADGAESKDQLVTRYGFGGSSETSRRKRARSATDGKPGDRLAPRWTASRLPAAEPAASQDRGC